MRLREHMRRQFARPSGFIGSLVGVRMARTTAVVNALTLEQLDIQPGDHVLEVGFGPGLAIARVAEQVTGGFVAGAELSRLMARTASRRNRRAIAAGRVGLVCASMDALPYADARFDKLFAVNTIYFWPDLRAYLAEARRVLAPGGMLAIGFGTRGQGRTCLRPPARLYSVEEVVELLRTQDFCDIRVTDRWQGRRLWHCVSGRR